MQSYGEMIQGVVNEVRHTHRKNIQELKKILSEKNATTANCIAYFSHSLSIAPSQDESHLVMGNFHVHNLRSTSIHKPVILFTLKGDIDVKFSGKFAVAGSSGTSPLQEWERVETEGDPKKEYCFRYFKKEKITSGEKLSFPDFQLKFNHHHPTSLSVEGFFYCEEIPQGIKALNTIHLST